LEKLAEAVIAGQLSVPAPREHTALLRWLAQSTANANPDISEGELAEQIATRFREIAEAGDETAEAVMEAQLDQFLLAIARTIIALEGAPWVPEPPAIPKQQRMDSIAATVLELTSWTSVDSKTVRRSTAGCSATRRCSWSAPRCAWRPGSRCWRTQGCARCAYRTPTRARWCW
jgi:hypothetical protein